MLEPSVIFLQVATLVVALALTARIVPGIVYEGPMSLLGAAVLYKTFTLGIWLVGPSLSAVIRIGPMGITIVIHAALLWVVGKAVPGFSVNGVGSALLGALVVGVAQFGAGFLISFAGIDGLILVI